MPHARARWMLLGLAALTLGVGGAGTAVTATAHRSSPARAPGPVEVARPSLAAHLDEALLHPTATPRSQAAPRPVVAARPRPHAARHRVTRARRVTGRTFEEDLRRAVARIPFYRPGVARWVVQPGLASYGLTNRRTGTVYVSPRVPRRLLYSVVAHEWGHIISTHGYAGLAAADAAVLKWFGGSSVTEAIEIAADCVARVLGATWTHYTSCADAHRRYGARYLMVGWRLPESAPQA
jgi:hypothetical protein